MHQLVKDALGFGPTNTTGSEQKQLRPKHQRLWRWLLIVAVALLVGFSIVMANWPFSRTQVIANLEEAMQGRVEIRKFRRTFFPHPGCVAEDVTFTGYGNLRGATPITVRKLTIEGSFRGMFTHHVPLLRGEGVRIVADSAGAFAGWEGTSKSTAIVDEYIITDSVLEFSHRKGSSSAQRKREQAGSGLKFEITKLDVSNPGPGGVLRFQAALRNPTPPGDVYLKGSFGPWRSGQGGQTPLSGTYSFEHANLGAFHAIAGTLSSQGSFAGTLQQLEVKGKTETPDFEVTDTGHKVPLSTEFQARVNTRNGDVILQRVEARLGRSGISVDGAVAGSKGEKGKIASLDMTVHSGRIQDFLYLFLDDRVAAMNGAFTFKGHVKLPPGKEPFLQRVELEGDFGIGDARLHNPVTQSKLEALSERAEGEKDEPPERIVSDLKGHVELRGGTASFFGTSFRVPGAKARLHGTYSLVNYRIDLHGRLFTEATLPQATSGVKSFLLKVVSPFLKKNHRGGAVVALSITGVYPQPVYKTAPVTQPI